MELSLSLTKAILSALDANVATTFTAELHWNGKNVQLDIHSNFTSAVVTFLSTYPNLSVDHEFFVIGDRSGPRVIIRVHECVSEIDGNPRG